MIFSDVKTKLISLFEYEKLDGRMNTEWGFNNENDKDVKKMGYSTNLTPETIEEAVKHNVDLIITHHNAWPFVYGMMERCRELLNKYKIPHAFFHAPLDDAGFGTSASLADALKLNGCYKAIPYEEIYLAGTIGELNYPMEFDLFVKELSNILSEPIKAFKNNDNLVHKVCITTGAGNMTSDIKIAVENNCDSYVTGEYNLYSQQYAKIAGINLLVGSHTNTEILGVRQMVSRLISDTDMEAIRLFEENY